MYITINKKIMKKHLIKDEANFAKELAHSLSPTLSEQEKRVIDIRYGLDYGGIVNFVNGYLRRLIKAIKKNRMSMDGFSTENAKNFSGLLNSKRLDSELQSELSHLLYGADERTQYML